MHLKPPPKLQWQAPEKAKDALHQSLDNVADAVRTVPKRVEAESLAKQSQALQAEKQATLAYFADLMGDFFGRASQWLTLPVDEAEMQFNSYAKGALAELPEKLKARFAERLEVYGNAMFATLHAKNQRAMAAQHLQNFETLTEQLEGVVLLAAKLPLDQQEAVISTAFGDYHQALVAGVEAGFVTQDVAEFMAEDLQHKLLLATIETAIENSAEPLLLAIQIADGTTGEAAIDELPQDIRQSFLANLIAPKEVHHD